MGKRSKKRRKKHRTVRGPFRFLNHLMQTASGERAELLKGAMAFHIQNVAEYYLAGNDKEFWDEEKDFPCLAPPSPIMWMEYETTSEIHSEGKVIEIPEEDRANHGFIITSLDLEDPDCGNIIKNAKGDMAAMLTYCAERDDVRWVSLVSCYVSAKIGGGGRITALSPAKFSYLVGPNGNLAASSVEGRFAGVVTLSPAALEAIPMEQRAETLSYMLKGSVTTYHPCMLALSLMHCKNVEVEDMPDPDAPPPLMPGRRPTRRQRVLRARYHVLRIENSVGKQIGKRTGSGRHAATAMHICRGHFKAFGPKYGKGRLYGKHEGMYWWNMHARGNRSDGVVLKDYDVRT